MARNVSAIVCVRQWVGSFAEWSSFKKNYHLVIIVALYCTPLFFIAILYVIILLKLKSQKIPGEPSVNTEQQRIKRERNVLKMSVAIVLACALCWLPFSIGWLLSLVSTDSGLKSSCGFKYYMSTAFLLVCLHCAINPFICCIFSGNYRQGLKNLLSCFSAGGRSNQATPYSNRKE